MGWLLLAVQFVDILWSMLVLLGLEKLNIVPGFAAASSLEFVYFPFSHSLVAFLVWAGVFYATFRLMPARQEVNNPELRLLWVWVFLSHFVLDVIVHSPDMTISVTIHI